MKQRILITLFAAWYALSSLANGTKIDGIHYILNDNNMTASVTYTGSELSLNDDNPYIGEITIPSIVSITYMENNIVHYKYYSVTSIGSSAFSVCPDLTNVNIPNSVTSIGSHAFWGCTGLTNINIPNSVTSIGFDAFLDCTGLTNITIPNSVTSIDQGAFSGCTGLTNITIPNSVTSIGKGAFQDCNGLTSITIPNSVTSIGSQVFDGCTGLTSVFVQNSSITRYEFEGCYSLIQLHLGNGVKTIGEYSFHNCTKLKDIVWGNSIESINSYAFQNCSSLDSISLPNSLKTIGSYAFNGCTALKSVVLPNSLISIERGVFEGCNVLKNIVLPNSLNSIGSFAFSKCTNLKEITIPNSVTSIGSSAFRYTRLRTVTIGNSVESIGQEAFNSTGVLNNIFVLRSTPPKAQEAFSSSSYSATLHVPVGTRELYSQTSGWKAFNSIVDDIPNYDNETNKTESITTRTTAGEPMSFDEFKALAGTGKHFAIVASSEHSLVYPKWFSFSSEGYPTTLSSAQLFDLENSETGEGWYNIKRVSDNLYVSTEGGNFDADTKMDFKLVNRLAGDYWSEFSDASLHISFDNAEGNHYNANTTNLGFRSGTGGYSTYVAYGPFCLVEVNYLDKNNNPLRASESYIVAEGTSFEAPVIMGKAVRGENVVAVSKDQTVNFIYDDATFDYKVIVNGAVEGMNVSIKGEALTYGQTDYSNAEAVSESDVVVSFTEGAEFLSYRVSINGIYIVIDCEDSRWPVSFHKWQTFTRTDRHINSVTFNDQTVDGLYTDYRTTCYQDFTATKTVTLPAETSIKPSFDVLGQWMHGFVYIDLNNDGDFSDEGELVSYVNENNPNLAADLPEFISPATAGTYRMRVKMDWESLDPGGNTGEDPEDVNSKNHIIKNGGAIIDLKLVVTSAVTSINPIRDAKSGVTYYNLKGQRTTRLQRGVNIIRYSDGTTKKVLVK